MYEKPNENHGQVANKAIGPIIREERLNKQNVEVIITLNYSIIT